MVNAFPETLSYEIWISVVENEIFSAIVTVIVYLQGMFNQKHAVKWL